MKSKPADDSVVVCPVCGLTLPGQIKKCPQDGVLLKGISPPDPFVGTIIAGRYEILSVIGHGGMSVVYKARNRAVGSIVAVKTLKHDLISDEELFARFCQEAKAVQTLTHPNILAVHEFGVTLTGQPFIVMDYLDGVTLSDVIDEEGRIGVKRTLKIFIQVCDALAHAHAHKIIHRDVKPGNIMLVQTATDTDVVKVFDFGFAKLLPSSGLFVQQLTQTGDVLGTPLYMSPEQSRGKQLDSRSDIYAVGCVMYEALTGKAPLIGDNVLDTMQKQINERPESLDTARPDLYIPEQLTNVLFKTLEKELSRRYQSMVDVRRDLEVILNGLTGKGSMPKGLLPGMSKMREIPPEPRWQVQSALIWLVSCALLAGAVAWGLDTLAHQSDRPATATMSTPALPNFVGDPPMVWAKYRQAALQSSDRNNYAEAEELLALAMKQAFKTEDADSREATTDVDFARLYLREDKLSDAEKAADNALALRQKLGEINGRSAADVFSVYAQIALAREDWKSADSFFQKALAIQQRELGPMHQDVATTLNGLGKATEGQKTYSRSEAYYKQALAIRQTALGPNKPAVADTLSDYIRLLRKQHRTKEADKLEKRARAIRDCNAE